jgi:hypothetical protein
LRYCTADVLRGSVGEVEVAHHVLGFRRIKGDVAPVDVRHQSPVAAFGEPVDDALDLVVEPPPLLDNNDARRAAASIRLAVVA